MAELEEMMPKFKANGTLKDPLKIAADLAEKKQKWIEDAALSPITGKILAIGIIDEDGFRCMDGAGDEKMLLSEFAIYMDTHLDSLFYGWCSHSFDCDFVRKRSWLMGVKSPISADFDPYRQNRFHDLAWLWNCRDRHAHTSLATASKFFGLGDKLMDGKDFGKTWGEDRGKALAYLRDDCEKTLQIGQRMGVIPTV